jgi:hypothetical protein
MKKFTLTEKQLRTCFYALRLAAEWEDGVVDSYAYCTGSQDRKWSKESENSAKKFRKLRVEFAEMLGLELKTRLEKEIENGIAINTTEIKEYVEKHKEEIKVIEA